MNLPKLLLILEVLIFVYRRCYCNELLKKFHQSDYKIRNLRMEVLKVNKTLMHEFRGIGHKYNRTTVAFNVTFWPKIDLEDKLECVMQTFKRASNEYRLFPMRFQVNACKVIDNNVLGMKSIANYGNYSLCYWKKDVLYVVRNFPVDETHLPPFIPTGEFKAQVELLHFKSHLALVNMYAEIYRPEV